MQDNRVLDYKAREAAIDKIMVCGKNRGNHEYIPITWVKSGDLEHVKTLMCTNCFQRVEMRTLYDNFSEAKL